MSDNSDDCYISFLPMGKTGIGKSTFLNLIGNSQFFKTSSLPESCTTNVDTYKFRYENNIVVPIDVPGFNDSKGKNQENMNKLTNFLKKYEYGLNAVAILISGSDHRLDGDLQKSIKYLYNFFGDGNFWSHVCIVVTHSPYYKEDIEELKMSMTTGENSLHSEMQRMIKDVCNLDKEPEIPFFFFDSKHPENSTTKESLPKFMNWLINCSSFKTQNLEIKDVHWQYQESRHETQSTNGPKKPIYKLVPGEPKMITIDEDVPYTVKEKRTHYVDRDFEEWVTRKWDVIDCLIIPRLFRNNKVKKIVTKRIAIETEDEVLKHKTVKKTVFSGQFGENTKELKGYYQEKTSVIETYTACWAYDCNPEDIKNKTNPIKKDSKFSKPEITTTYFDNKSNTLDPNNESGKIEELKLLIG